MLETYPCPVCHEESWQPIQRFRYRESDAASGPILRGRRARNKLAWLYSCIVRNRPWPRDVALPMARTLTRHQLLRWRILFEKWFPGRKEVWLTSQACGQCGFVAYSPRPTDEDMRAKHSFLGEFPPTVKGSPLARYRDQRRAERIYDAVRLFVDKRELVVLDYGGGDGKLAVPFRDRGHRCLVVDFSERQLPGITRIATEIDDVEDEINADVMICSHVLEHLASPLETLSKLQRHLAPDGILYSEVPDQVWLGIRIEEDPVTHINFFTEASFLELHRRAGFEIVEHTKRPGTYGVQQTPIIVVLARPLAAEGASVPESVESDTDRLLHPGRLYSLGRLLRYYVWAKLANQLRARSLRSQEGDKASS